MIANKQANCVPDRKISPERHQKQEHHQQQQPAEGQRRGPEAGGANGKWNASEQQTNATPSETAARHRRTGAVAPAPAPANTFASATFGPAPSLATASAKIQQRQQKFLAAAAKSATNHLRRAPADNMAESAWRTPLLPARLAPANDSATTRACCQPTKLAQRLASNDHQQPVAAAGGELARNSVTTGGAGGAKPQQQQQQQQQTLPSKTAPVMSARTDASAAMASAANAAGRNAKRDDDKSAPAGLDTSRAAPAAAQESGDNVYRQAAATSEHSKQHEVRQAGEKDEQVRKKANQAQIHQDHICKASVEEGIANLHHQPHNQIITQQRHHFYNNINNNHHYYHNNLHNHQQQTQTQQNVMAHYKFHNDCQSSVLTYEQVKRLDFVMDQTVPIHGRGNSPTLYVKLKELIRLVKYKLQQEHSIEIRDVRLNGGAASYVLAPENSHYNDLDLIFGTDLSDEDRFDVIRDVVLECLIESQSNHHQYCQMPLNNCAIKEAYVHKMVKVNDDDRWSLISLGVQQSDAKCCNQQQQQQQQQQQHAAIQRSEAITAFGAIQEVDGQWAVVNGLHTTRFSDEQELGNQQECGKTSSVCANGRGQVDKQQHNAQPWQQQTSYHNYQKQFPNSIELKFVDRMRRKFEFSVDSFQIILDSLIQFYDYAPQSTIAIQRKLVNSHPSSTMINTRPLIDKRKCSGCYNDQRASFDCSSNHSDDELSCRDRETYGRNAQDYQVINNFLETKHHCRLQHHHHHHHHRHCSQCYYQLPLEPTNSPSNSSVASSSGCSSSSSVVSSSSSSLSCDDDHEDLYCDADSSPSSSASTSSLLSSTTISMLSSSGTPCNVSDMKSKQQTKCKNLKSKESLEVTTSAATTTTTSKTSKNVIDDCVSIGCFDHNGQQSKQRIGSTRHQQHQQISLVNRNVCDFEANTASCAVISENFYPTVIGRSEYGNFKEALYHLEKKLIATRSPEEIRGGGLLKYCNLLVKNYKPTNVYQTRTLERYMCSRFFIDFSDLNQQRAKLESYLANHFSDDPIQKFDYLTILHNVVQRSTVCLMNHELRLTLNMIRDLAYKLSEQQQQAQGQDQQHLTVQAQQQAHQSVHHTQEQQQQYYQQQEPVVMQSGVYRVKLVNYALVKPVKS